MTTMTQETRWPQFVGPIAAIWYAFGLYQCWMAFSTMGDTAPGWVWAAFALASGAGLAGALALFTNNRIAVPIFALSLVSAVIYYVWLYAFGTPNSEDLPITIMVLAVTTVLLFVSKRRFG